MDLLNWETDIDIAMNPVPDIGRLHNGFYRALFQVSTVSSEPCTSLWRSEPGLRAEVRDCSSIYLLPYCWLKTGFAQCV